MAEQRHAAEYTAEDIQVLEGMEAVRRRPGMYIGSTDHRGLHHLIYEIVDNAVDEAMAGHCTSVLIRIATDGSVSVEDDGRGIPVDVHPATGKTAVETVMTTLHAGAKFGGKGYSVSGGLHGVGASVVNALSSWLRVEVKRDGFLHTQDFQRGIVLGPLEKGRAINGTGTITSFMPDEQIFGPPDYDFDTLSQRFKEMAYLNKGLKISLRSDWHKEQGYSTWRQEYLYEGGIVSFVSNLNHGKEVLQAAPIYVQKIVEGTTVEAAFQYNAGFSDTTFSFANCINTVDGGTHLTGFRTALTRALNDYARKQKLIKDDQPNFSGEDVREGLTTVLSVKLMDPQFEGQTKGQAGELGGEGIRGDRGRRGPHLLPGGAPPGGQAHHRKVPHGSEGTRGSAQGQGPGAAQERHGRRIAPWQAGGLLREEPCSFRALPGGGRVRRRLGQGGP